MTFVTDDPVASESVLIRNAWSLIWHSDIKIRLIAANDLLINDVIVRDQNSRNRCIGRYGSDGNTVAAWTGISRKYDIGTLVYSKTIILIFHWAIFDRLIIALRHGHAITMNNSPGLWLTRRIHRCSLQQGSHHCWHWENRPGLFITGLGEHLQGLKA